MKSLRYFLIALILLFYIFFFIRALRLSKSLGKNIKAKNPLLNGSIILAGLSSVIFLAYLTVPSISEYLIILYLSNLLTIIGSILITLGLIASTIASLTLRKSWRIGVDENEKTELITNGIYQFSRNPYFLSYDLVLIGMVFCLISPFLILSVLVTIGLFHLLILKEEKYLENKHQEDYRKYKKEVRRYL
jgi:protein-S-isoprenylcysteine O-methyltransferase Ste14